MRDGSVLLMGALGMGAGPTESNPLAPIPPPNVVTPKASSLPNGGWGPAAVPRASQWSTATGVVRYILHSGDTLNGLAQTYLGAPERWKEIWSLNSSHYPAWTPDSIPVGSQLVMPPDAIANAKSRGFLPFTVSTKTGKKHTLAFGIGAGVGLLAIGGGVALVAHARH